ncbi:MAG: VIT1/CCC1 transporter family protein [Candidatus Limnocylindria bacterium]
MTPSADPLVDAPQPDRRTRIERATLREILMGAQDNLTNVLAVVLGVAIGAGRSDLVALAGLAAGVAEAISMGGVLYTSTRAELDLELRVRTESAGGGPAERRRSLSPAQAGLVCFGAAIVAGLIPLVPFAFLPLQAAVVTCFVISILALFGVGSWAGGVTGRSPWRDGLRLVLIAGTAALAAATIGMILRID